MTHAQSNRPFDPVPGRKGLKDGDVWQKGYLKAGSEAMREIDFWIGE
jgi:hypothetical protein